MNDFFLLLISSLAVWRGAELVAIDNGPFHIFKRLRVVSRRIGPVTGELFSCPYCQSLHWALWTCALLVWQGLIHWHLAPLWWFGIGGGSIAIMRAVRPRE